MPCCPQTNGVITPPLLGTLTMRAVGDSPAEKYTFDPSSQRPPGYEIPVASVVGACRPSMGALPTTPTASPSVKYRSTPSPKSCPGEARPVATVGGTPPSGIPVRGAR